MAPTVTTTPSLVQRFCGETPRTIVSSESTLQVSTIGKTTVPRAILIRMSFRNPYNQGFVWPSLTKHQGNRGHSEQEAQDTQTCSRPQSCIRLFHCYFSYQEGAN